MPVVCKLPGGSGSGGGSADGLKLNIFTQPTEPETKDGIWIQKNNTHKNIVVDNLISNDGEWSDVVSNNYPGDKSSWIEQYVTYNDAIVTLDDNGLWSFNGSTWTKIAEALTGDSLWIKALCVINNVLIAIGETGVYNESTGEWVYTQKIWKLNGPSWSNPTTISYDFGQEAREHGVVYNGYLYTIWDYSPSVNGSYDSDNQWLTLMRMSSSGSCTMVQKINKYLPGHVGMGVVFNNQIYWELNYFDNGGSGDHTHVMATYNGGSTLTLTENKFPFSNDKDYSQSAVVYDNVIHTLLTFYNNSSYDRKHYKYDGSTWTYLFDLDDRLTFVALNTTLYGFYDRVEDGLRKYTKTHSKYDPQTLIIQANDTFDGTYATALVDTSSAITGANARFVTRFDDVFFVGESGMDTEDPIYYGDGTKWVKFKN